MKVKYTFEDSDIKINLTVYSPAREMMKIVRTDSTQKLYGLMNYYTMIKIKEDKYLVSRKEMVEFLNNKKFIPDRCY